MAAGAHVSDQCCVLFPDYIFSEEKSNHSLGVAAAFVFHSDSGVSPVHDPGTEFQEGTHVQNERD